jgi:hypothetical protein
MSKNTSELPSTPFACSFSYVAVMKCPERRSRQQLPRSEKNRSRRRSRAAATAGSKPEGRQWYDCATSSSTCGWCPLGSSAARQPGYTTVRSGGGRAHNRICRPEQNQKSRRLGPGPSTARSRRVNVGALPVPFVREGID